MKDEVQHYTDPFKFKKKKLLPSGKIEAGKNNRKAQLIKCIYKCHTQVFLCIPWCEDCNTLKCNNSFFASSTNISHWHNFITKNLSNGLFTRRKQLQDYPHKLITHDESKLTWAGGWFSSPTNCVLELGMWKLISISESFCYITKKENEINKILRNTITLQLNSRLPRTNSCD